MIKYKVKDAANDFGVSNKKITEILEKHCGVTKKTMTSLEESELDVIFDVITKENSVESFDAYFATKTEKKPEEKTCSRTQSRAETRSKRRKETRSKTRTQS